MKIFERDGKINFIDKNNVLVGFDYSRSCCEDFGWFVAETEKEVDVEEQKILKEKQIH